MSLKRYLLLFCLLSMTLQATPIDRAAIIVNNQIILQSEIDRAVQQIKQQAKSEQLNEEALIKQVQERLITDKLQLAIAKSKSLTISDLQLDQALEKQAQQKNITLEQLRKTMTPSGQPFATYREELRQQMQIAYIQRARMLSKITISEAAIDTLVANIEQANAQKVKYRIAHILISTPLHATNTDINASKQRAEELKQQLDQGADFKTLAMNHSDGAEAKQGGEWDYMDIHAMPSLFKQSIKQSQPNTIIGPLKSSSGFHLIKILDIQGQQHVYKEQVRCRHILLKKSPILNDQQAQRKLQTWLKNIQADPKLFEIYAKEHSQDPASSHQGGQLPLSDPDVYVPEFAQQLKQLKVGALSQPFKTMHGWHIVQVQEKKTFDQISQIHRNQARQMLFQRQYMDELQLWLHELRLKAFVKYIEPIQPDA
jgi:peptidyl-prolyl cis-trans isomerase SurA